MSWLRWYFAIGTVIGGVMLLLFYLAGKYMDRIIPVEEEEYEDREAKRGIIDAWDTIVATCGGSEVRGALFMFAFTTIAWPGLFTLFFRKGEGK